MMQSMYIGTYLLVNSILEGADIVIEPKMIGIGVGDFHRARECILQGELATQNSIPEIKKLLEA